LENITHKYKYNINDVINGNIKILNLIRINHGKHTIKGYKYECLQCKYIGKMDEYHLKANRKCPICSNKKVKIGINDMWTTNPSLANLLHDKNDGFKYTQASSVFVNWKCDKCENIIINKSINNISKRGLSCPKCSDGVSYAQKFMYNVLIQLGIEFTTEHVFSWSKNIEHTNTKLNGTKIYDFYIENKNIIIEVHGNQHYEKSFPNSLRTLKEERENDEIKECIAKINGITNYIIIDAQSPNLQYIKTNILDSEIINIFDLSRIDWIRCHEFACNSLVKSVCDLWNSGMNNTLDISKEIKLSRKTITKYLKQGDELDWCKYKKFDQQSNPVVQLNINTGEIINKYDSVGKAKSETGAYHISEVCKGEYKQSGGYKWMYKKDWEIQQSFNKKSLLIKI